MINKEERSRILSLFAEKEDKMFVGLLIDSINRFKNNNYIVNTNFLNLKEKNIAISILNRLNISYKIVSVFLDSERFIIFFVPDYIEEDEINIDEYITVLKIIPKVKGKLTHSKYMGKLYSLGIKEDMLGDIIVCDDICYVAVLKNIESYIYSNLFSISRIDVILESIKVNDKDLNNVRINFKSKDILVSSLRIDVILAALYNLSRNEVKSKIEAGDLMINSKEMFFVAYTPNEDDIVSFRRCGKFKIGKVVGSTKSGKIYLNLKEYI